MSICFSVEYRWLVRLPPLVTQSLPTGLRSSRSISGSAAHAGEAASRSNAMRAMGAIMCASLQELRCSAGIHDDEVVPIRHDDLRQRLRIHLVLLADDAVEVKEIRGDRIDLVVAQRLRLDVRHRAAHVVEDGGRIGPVAADRAHRCLARERALAADQAIVRLARALRAVARLALLLVHGSALRRGSATRGQADAIGPDADVPRNDIACGCRLAEIRRLDARALAHTPAGGAAGNDERYRDADEITRRHA